MKTFWMELALILAEAPVALAVIVKASGSTPRQVGAMQFLTREGRMAGSVGGGRMEALALEAAKETLADGATRMVEADLQGHPGALRDGICGGRMLLWVGRLERERDGAWVNTVSRNPGRVFHLHVRRGGGARILRAGAAVPVEVEEGDVIRIRPSPMVLIVGAGHIGRALARLADWIGFAVRIQDDRVEWLEPTAFPKETMLEPDLAVHLRELMAWEGRRLVVLVTRGFPQDQAVLPPIAEVEGLDYLGVLGSRVRWKALETDCQQRGVVLPDKTVLHAPVGLRIGAETPEEIAVSIVGEMIARVRGIDPTGTPSSKRKKRSSK